MIVLVFNVSGCGTYRFYDGPERPDTEVAIIKGYWHPYLLFDVNVTIQEIDMIAKGFIPHGAKVLPGKHRIVIHKSITIPYVSIKQVCSFTLDVKAGHRYLIGGIDYKLNNGRVEDTWTIRITDRTASGFVTEHKLPADCSFI